MVGNKQEVATFAGGCFWCTEAIFKRLKGVSLVQSGYTGGNKKDPTYEEVSSGTTGHAEAVQITFDPHSISYEELLDVFFTTHDPTTLNRQGNDTGTQYRSAIFYHDGTQKQAAENAIASLEKAHTHIDPIVTEVVPFETFYKAEGYHKDYYDKNTQAPYCRLVIDPKIQKLMEHFRNDVKDEYK